MHRCLVKDVDNRWQSARDLFHELTWIQRAWKVNRVTSRSGRANRRVASSSALAAACSMGDCGARSRRRRYDAMVLNLATRSSAGQVRRLAIELPDGERLALARTTPAGLCVALAISPDGTTVVYAGRRLYVRRLDSSARGCHTDGPTRLSSPDGRWIAFVSGDRLRKVALSGGDAARAMRSTGRDGARIGGVE